MNYTIIAILILTSMEAHLNAAADLYSNQKFDYNKSDLVLVGRVVGAETTVESDEAAKQRNNSYFGFHAKVKITKTYKGDFEPGKDILIYIGGYWSDNNKADLNMTPLSRGLSAEPHSFEIGKVYLLFLNKELGRPAGKETWIPRSQQKSIVPIIMDGDIPKVLSFDQKAEIIPLDTFINVLK